MFYSFFFLKGHEGFTAVRIIPMLGFGVWVLTVGRPNDFQVQAMCRVHVCMYVCMYVCMCFFCCSHFPSSSFCLIQPSDLFKLHFFFFLCSFLFLRAFPLAKRMSHTHTHGWMDGWMDGSWMYAHTLARMDTHGQTYTCSYLSSNDHHILSLNQKLKTEDSRLGTISSTLIFFF